MNSIFKEFQEILLQVPSKPIKNFGVEDQASVAIVIRITVAVDVLFIKRATRAGDRWSGQMAFPGGRREKEDSTQLETAIRETKEEVGLVLTKHSFIGNLDDVQARKSGKLLNFKISPHLFVVEDQKMDFILDKNEVEQVFWIPLEHLLNKENHIEFCFERGNLQVFLPGIQFLDNTIWGLSYMMLFDFVYRFKKHSLLKKYTKDLSYWNLYPAHEVKT